MSAIFIAGADGMAALSRTNNAKSGQGYSTWFQPPAGSKAGVQAGGSSTEDKAGTFASERVGKELHFYASGHGQPPKQIGTVEFGDHPIENVAFQIFPPASRRRSTSSSITSRSRPTTSPAWSLFHRPTTDTSPGSCLDWQSLPSRCSAVARQASPIGVRDRTARDRNPAQRIAPPLIRMTCPVTNSAAGLTRKHAATRDDVFGGAPAGQGGLAEDPIVPVG